MVTVRAAKPGGQALDYLRTEPRFEEVPHSIAGAPPSIGFVDPAGASADGSDKSDPL
jgi:hypothetical protein